MTLTAILSGGLDPKTGTLREAHKQAQLFRQKMDDERAMLMIDIKFEQTKDVLKKEPTKVFFQPESEAQIPEVTKVCPKE